MAYFLPDLDLILYLWRLRRLFQYFLPTVPIQVPSLLMVFLDFFCYGNSSWAWVPLIKSLINLIQSLEQRECFSLLMVKIRVMTLSSIFQVEIFYHLLCICFLIFLTMQSWMENETHLVSFYIYYIAQRQFDKIRQLWSRHTIL